MWNSSTGTPFSVIWQNMNLSFETTLVTVTVEMLRTGKSPVTS